MRGDDIGFPRIQRRQHIHTDGAFRSGNAVHLGDCGNIRLIDSDGGHQLFVVHGVFAQVGVRRIDHSILGYFQTRKKADAECNNRENG
ncbi:hypothetical protein SDC9_114742 [bioreactor metagenome]|uniref:Uncharacterized protein n=1 Tax=bioreactor metagenome TaxID=1076179 RepID=A0A645BRF9_9ZZZZ